jgi:NADH:ubiquinone oxidoreductase subunit 5 (subunit L)/multisubunit Na+/H+ antiporter MnhA subunit
VDDFYSKVIVGGVKKLGLALGWFDAHVVDGVVNGAAALVRRLSNISIGFDRDIVDGAVNGIGSVSRLISRGLRGLQTGFVYNYALSIVVGIVIIISLVVTIL